MISIKTFLGRNEETLPLTLKRAFALVVETMALHAVDCGRGERAAFQEAARRIASRFEEVERPEEALVIAGEAISTITQYATHIERAMNNRQRELGDVVRMLSSTVIDISNQGATAGENLADIQKKLSAVSQIDELRSLKDKLSDCLRALRLESLRQRKQAEETAANLKSKLRLSSMAAGELTRDAPSNKERPVAEDRLEDAENGWKYIEGAHAAARGLFIALFSIERLESVESRFGAEAAEAVLASFTEQIQARLGGPDKLFRWYGASVLAVLDRAVSTPDVRSEISSFVGPRFECLVQSGAREAIVTVAASFMLSRLDVTKPLPASLSILERSLVAAKR